MMDNQILDNFKEDNSQLKQQLYQCLLPGEMIEWVAQPKQGILLRKNDGCMIPFSLVWGGFVLLWEGIAILNQHTFFIIFGFPFVLLGLYIILGRFFHDIYKRKNTIYALSNLRLILKKGAKLQTYFYTEIKNLKIVSHRKGRGSIFFNEAVEQKYNSFESPNPCFEQIEDANRLYRTIQQKIKN
jgi:hypothetical protein